MVGRIRKRVRFSKEEKHTCWVESENELETEDVQWRWRCGVQRHRRFGWATLLHRRRRILGGEENQTRLGVDMKGRKEEEVFCRLLFRENKERVHFLVFQTWFNI